MTSNNRNFVNGGSLPKDLSFKDIQVAQGFKTTNGTQISPLSVTTQITFNTGNSYGGIFEAEGNDLWISEDPAFASYTRIKAGSSATIPFGGMENVYLKSSGGTSVVYFRLSIL